MTDTLTPMDAPATRRRSSRPFAGRSWLVLGKHVLLIAFGLTMLYPLLWMVSSSLKPDELIFRDPSLIPTALDPTNYSDGWNGLQRPFSHY